MPSDRTVAIVLGYHECSYPPRLAYQAGLTERFAVIFGNEFDADLFIGILTAIGLAIPHDSLAIELNAEQHFPSIRALSEWYLSQQPDDRDAPIGVRLFGAGRLVAIAETEFWVLAGGPWPYHDSYTLSFYTPEGRAEEFLGICERISKELALTITSIHKASVSKEPFVPFWKAPLKWLGLKPW